MNARRGFTLGAAVLLGIWPGLSQAQGRAGQSPPATARASAPIDLTGYWVSLINEDWRYRMITPTKGDYQGVPMTAEARKIADAWDPTADTSAGLQCKSYGAAMIMRVPGRLHITWADEDTMRVETDANNWTSVAELAVRDIERRSLLGDIAGAQRLTSAIASRWAS